MTYTGSLCTSHESDATIFVEFLCKNKNINCNLQIDFHYQSQWERDVQYQYIRLVEVSHTGALEVTCLQEPLALSCEKYTPSWTHV